VTREKRKTSDKEKKEKDKITGILIN